MIDIHVHNSPALNEKLDEIINKLDFVIRQQRRVMATQEELLNELGEINRTTDELAKDVEDLIVKVGQPGDPAEKEEIKSQLVTLKAKLQAIASQHEPNPALPDPTDPNVTGKARRPDLKAENKTSEFGKRTDPFNP